MGSLLIKNMACLAGIGNPQLPLRGPDLQQLQTISNAWLVVEGGHIAAFGSMDKLETHLQNKPATVVDAAGQTVLPAWCDSHTHLVFAASREEEFIDKIKGLSYAEIAARGGGILNSARKLNNCPEDELFRLSWNRLQEVTALGTGA